MSEIERQARSWWDRLLAWLRGAQNGDAARKAREKPKTGSYGECPLTR